MTHCLSYMAPLQQLFSEAFSSGRAHLNLNRKSTNALNVIYLGAQVPCLLRHGIDNGMTISSSTRAKGEIPHLLTTALFSVAKGGCTVGHYTCLPAFLHPLLPRLSSPACRFCGHFCPPCIKDRDSSPSPSRSPPAVSLPSEAITSHRALQARDLSYPQS